MIDIIIELVTNLVQSVMFTGFLYLFFHKPENKRKEIIGLIISIILLFGASTYFTFNIKYLNFIDTIIYISIIELYTLLFLKGNVFVKLIMPIFAFFTNTIISFATSYTVSYFAGQSYLSLVTQSTSYRYLCIAVINITNAFFLYLIIRIREKKLNITKMTDVTAFIIIPAISMTIIYSTLYVLALSEYQSNILIHLLLICLCMIAIAVIVWLMMIRISKDNNVKTKLLLMQQREKFYESNILQSNQQIEKISKIKHDMKNNLLCIDELISNDKFKEAKQLCNELSERLLGIYTPINTNNSLLNAVINVELEKAANSNISFTVNISDELIEFAQNPDIVSIIGNICDNAIEYLQQCPEDIREMILEISRRKSYSVIICRNRTHLSVLGNNPDLKTHKSDKTLHGKGIEIVKDYVKKYDGDIKYYEKDNYFYASAIIKIQSLPEK